MLLYKNNELKKYAITDNVIMDIYEGKLKVPSKKDLKLSDEKYNTYISEIKQKISENDLHIPLYDIYSNTIFMVVRDQVYNRVMWNHYRLPTKEIMTQVKKIYIPFLELYDLTILNHTYKEIIYKSTVGKDVTLCLRPSFIPAFTHIRPYYTKSEVVNLALNMNLISDDVIQKLDKDEHYRKKYYDDKKFNELCNIVTRNDMSSNVLISHRKHIIKNNINIVQYYSLNGSYFMNRYLRNLSKDEIKNQLLEDNITEMNDIINTAPEFDKNYIVYRFVNDDSFISSLSLGDIFIETGFMSTTRDPFYRADIYKFGFTLLKINIPKNKKGVALAIDSFSNFPEEHEIVFSPNTKFKLINRDNKCKYYHIDSQYEAKIIKKYEFEYVGKSVLKFEQKKKTNEVFIDLDKLSLQENTLEKRIIEFQETCVNEINQFSIKIGDKQFTLLTEWYDSTIAYKGLYAIENKNGFTIYCFYSNKLLFFLEIMESLHELHVNYYFKFSDNTELYKVIPENDFIMFLCKLSYVFGIQKVIIYGTYSFCYKMGNIQSMGSYRIDFIEYLTNGTKRYSEVLDVKSKFDYLQLDNFKNISPERILFKDDPDELYQVWKLSNCSTIAELYVYISKNYCSFLKIYENKIQRLYPTISTYFNPFLYDYYIVDPIKYLYNRNIISTLPQIDTEVLDMPKLNLNRSRR